MTTRQWRASPPRTNYITQSTIVRELARAADIIDRTRRNSASAHPSKKGCEKALKILNDVIVDTLKPQEEAG